MTKEQRNITSNLPTHGVRLCEGIPSTQVCDQTIFYLNIILKYHFFLCWQWQSWIFSTIASVL